MAETAGLDRDEEVASSVAETTVMKGGDEYVSLVAATNDEEAVEATDGQETADMRSQASSSAGEAMYRLLQATLLPDDSCRLYGIQLFQGPAVIRLLKFVTVTVLAIVGVHLIVRLPQLNLEHDGDLTLSEMWVYESTIIMRDIIVFFFVARLHERRGVDHIAFVATVVLSQLYWLFIPALSFLQHSVTLYEIHCRWPWQLWVFVALLIPLIVALVVLHVHYAVRHGIFAQKVIEMGLAVLFFMAPYLSSKYLHLHHWYAGWIIGMHCNFETWWSAMTLAWCWGTYINGVAVYGRDPMLTCGYAYFVSHDQRCPFLDCYDEAIEAPEEHPHVQPMRPPNWRNCSADSYHP